MGVVDERIDYELLARLAAETKGSVVLVGPLTKVEQEALPKHDNLHWLGGRQYDDLPAFLKGFDVCLMPFALNEATAFINPTKALEYMASGKPIVSTAVEDVVSQFSDVVQIAETKDEFVSLAQQSDSERDPLRIERGLALVKNNSWESIVSQLEQRIQETLNTKKAAGSKAA
jgi:glycosyltransferase involved in cell wall biosynthesis